MKRFLVQGFLIFLVGVLLYQTMGHALESKTKKGRTSKSSSKKVGPEVPPSRRILESDPPGTQFNEDGDKCDSVFEKRMLASPIGEACEPPDTALKQKIKKSTEFFTEKPLPKKDLLISNDCIRLAMNMSKANTRTNPYIRMYRCESDVQGVGGSSGAIRIYKPCDTNHKLSDHVAQVITRALKCVNSLGDPKISGEEIFKLINHESRFVPTVQNSGGIGIMQLTSDAAKEFHRDGSLAQNYRTQMPDHSECEMFMKLPWIVREHKLVMAVNAPKTKVKSKSSPVSESPVAAKKVPSGPVKPCQFLTPQFNPTRSIIYGLATYKQFKQIAIDIINKKETDGSPSALEVLKENGLGDKETLKELTVEMARFSYNLGQKWAKVAWKNYINFLRKRKLQPSNSITIMISPASPSTTQAPGVYQRAKDLFNSVFGTKGAEREKINSADPKDKSALEKLLPYFMEKTEDTPPDTRPELPSNEDIEKDVGGILSRFIPDLREQFSALKVKFGDKKYTTKIDADYKLLQDHAESKGVKCEF